MPFSGDCTVTYEVRGQVVGQLCHYACGYTENGESYSAHWPHWAYFCPYCGEIWARARNEFRFEYVTVRPFAPWSIKEAPCDTCGTGELDIDPQLLLETASDELLLYELIHLLKRKEYQ